MRRAITFPSCRWSHTQWLVTALTAVCVLLLVIEIQRPSYWIDEKISVDIASADSARQVIENVIQGERRPPAYHLGLWIWMGLLGNSERAARLYSAAWVTLVTPAAFQLTRRLADERSALFAAFVTASSPVLIAYGQTVRYYGMVATLSALSYALFWLIMKRERKPWAAYIVVTLLLLYCDYPAYGVVLAQNVLALVWWLAWPRRSHHPRWTWLGVQVGLAAAAALWIPVTLDQSTRNFGAADLSHSIVGAFLRLAYPFYAWVIGETLFPWSPLAVVGVLTGGALMVYGFMQLKRYDGQIAWLIAFICPFVTSQALLATVATDSPFVNAPARSMACAALVYALLGIGLAWLRPGPLLLAAMVLLTAPHGLALTNYYHGIDYINSVYNTPARDVAHVIVSQAAPEDAIVSEADSLIKVYLPPEWQASHFDPEQVTELQAWLAAHPRAGVWQVIMGRDRTRNDISARLSEWLRTRYSLHSSSGFAEQDAVYRKLKSRLLGREAYRYRLTLDRYDPKQDK